MRTRFCVRALASVLVVVVIVASDAYAQRDFYVPGSFQTPTMWDPPTSSQMTETSSGSGIYELLLTGLTEGQQYGFKILEDLSGDGVNWSNPDDPEITPADSWLINAVASGGETTIILDTNTYMDDFLPAMNRVIISDDIDTWNAVGDFMTEAGGMADWDNADSMFTMVDQGGGLFTLDATISDPGNYQWRAVNTGTFSGIATDQRRADQGDNFLFNTFEIDQDVTFKVDTTLGAISYETTAVLAGDTNGNFMVEFEADFGPIRDNFLENTFIRSEGDLVPDGIVDILDFRQWKDACLAIDCATPTQIADAFNSLPEPASGSLLLLALSGMAIVRRGR